MAKANWAGVNPASGSGDASITVSATANTGRSQRETKILISSSAGNKEVKVTQAGKTEFIQSAPSISIAKEAGRQAIYGVSNEPYLKFETSSSFITLDSDYIAAGRATKNDGTTQITNDPGATAEYEFQIGFSVTENTTESLRTGAIAITSGSLAPVNVVISQARTVPELTVDKNTISLGAADGSSATLNITSNTSWTIS